MAKNKNKKHKRRGLKAFLIIICLLIGTPVAFYFGVVYVKNTPKREYLDNSFNDALNTMIVDSLDPAPVEDADPLKNHVVAMRVSEDDLNMLLTKSTTKFMSVVPGAEFINQFYVEIDSREGSNEQSYTFVVEINVNKYVQTKITLETMLSLEDGGTGDKLDDYFKFRISSIGLGKIRGLNRILSKLVNDVTISKIFAKIGLNIKSDLANKQLKYAQRDFIKDLQRFADEESALYFAVIEDVIAKGCVDYAFNDPDHTNAILKLPPLHRNKLHDDNKAITLDIEDLKDKMVKTIDNHILENDGDIDYMLHYFIHGYKYMESSFTFSDTLKNLDLSSLGISDVENYEPLDSTSQASPNFVDLQDTFIDSFNISKYSVDHQVAEISESSINNYLSRSPIIGQNSILYRTLEDGSTKINYIVVDNFYGDITEDGINYLIGLNVNGYQVELELDTKFSEIKDNNTLVFSTDNLYFGNDLATDSMKEFFFKVLNTSFSKSSTMQISINEKEVSFRFDNAINDSPNKDLIASKTLSAGFDKDTNDGVMLIYAN